MGGLSGSAYGDVAYRDDRDIKLTFFVYSPVKQFITQPYTGFMDLWDRCMAA